MIKVGEALNRVEKAVKSIEVPELISVLSSVGCVLSSDVSSPINMPPFSQSAMDGYALYLHDSNHYTVISEVKAGDGHQPILKPGEAVRIFTGAPVPETANAVIMQESVSVDGSLIRIEGKVNLNDNIRPLGEQVKEGAVALKKGTKLTPAAIGFLTSLGITEVRVCKKPKIAIVATGNELVTAGEALEYGQIYESNSIMLQSALYSLGHTEVSVQKVNDDYKNTLAILDRVIKANDLVLISGGISVGDYDFVGTALKELEVNELFYKVRQKPGKPLFFGEKESTFVFALPGNPAAALSCFYIYVQTALNRLTGNNDYSIKAITAKSNSEFIKKGDRAQFLKAILKDGEVSILEGQSSAMLQTFALANAFVYVPEDCNEIVVDDRVEVISINGL